MGGVAGELVACRDGTALEVVPVGDPITVQLMRAIRNECRAGFSADNSLITAEQQAEWWARIGGQCIARLYREPFGAFVGYGLLRPGEYGRMVSSVAVLPEYAGRGYGGAITRHIIRQTDRMISAAALESNPAAMALHNTDDWIETERSGGIVYYETRGDVV